MNSFASPPADPSIVDVSEQTPYELISEPGAVPIKAWVRGVAFEAGARAQVANLARMPFVHGHVAVMPDVHAGIGATVGSVIATRAAIIPAAVGVDIGCGMMAVRTTLRASDLPDTLAAVRSNIERAVPHGRTANGGPGDRGAWSNTPNAVHQAWRELRDGLERIAEKHPRAIAKDTRTPVNQLCSLGGGNHFIEVCLDETQGVWFMLHSGSRGVGNRIGTYFIDLARKDMKTHHVHLPDVDLAYLSEGTAHFDDYVDAVGWAQNYARENRRLMMERVVDAVRKTPGIPPFQHALTVVDCHHNYVEREQHFGEDVLVTRKGAVRAREGDLGIIPGSMGARSFIVRGRGNPESFNSCSHGAGRRMSRTAAKAAFTVADHAAATLDVECRKDAGVIDETPLAYKSIDDVMAAQRDLVDIVHTLKQVICVKG